ncbi:hypothetical protein F4802DRAFT_157207 [Xylaria palmicola]|nr:hypothetical protein F4802DRAFT_157207 [Xylaria palmicola]
MSGNQRNRRSATGVSGMRLEPTPGKPPNGRVDIRDNRTAVPSSSQANRHVFFQKEGEENIVYRDSSVAILSHPSSIAGDISSVFASPRMSVDGHNDHGSQFQGSIFEVDDEIDDQKSTDPIPPDFDYRAVCRASPPTWTSQGAPVTRARARAQAPDIIGQTENGILADLAPESENLKAMTNNDEHQFPSILARQGRHVSRVKERRRGRGKIPYIDGFDGSVDGYNLADDGGSVIPPSQVENPKSDPGDDDYHLSESENVNSDSNESILRGIKSQPKRMKNKKPTKTKSSATTKAKQVPKIGAGSGTCKKISPSTANKKVASAKQRAAVLQQHIRSPSKQASPIGGIATVLRSMEGVTRGSEQKRSPGSHVFVKSSQEDTSPLKAKSKASSNRRPKKPFHENHLDEQQAKSDPGNTQQATVYSSFSKATRSQGTTRSQLTSQKKHSAPELTQPEVKRQKGNICTEHVVDQGKHCAIDQDRPFLTINNIDEVPSMPPPDHHLQAAKIRIHDTNQQNTPSYHIQPEPRDRLGSSKLNEQLTKEINEGRIMEDTLDTIEVPTQSHFPLLDFGPLQVRGLTKAKEEAQTRIVEDSPCHQKLYHREEPEAEAIGNGNTRRLFFKSPQHRTGPVFSRGDPVTTRVSKGCAQVTPSPKIFKYPENTQGSLHPHSRAWAQEISEKSRQKNLVSVSTTSAEETEPLDQMPIALQEARKDLATKRETVMGGRRDAVSESIHEITVAVLQNLQSKESAVDDIAVTYQRSGKGLVNALLDRQSIELGQTVTGFDSMCEQLVNLFEESARHAKTVGKRMASEDCRHFRGWAERKKVLEEALKVTREVVESI